MAYHPRRCERGPPLIEAEMNIHKTFLAKIQNSIVLLGKENKIPSDLDLSRVNVEPPRETGHGDMSTNAALVLAKSSGMKSLAIAELLHYT